MNDGLKSIFVFLFAAVVVGLSILVQPMAELGFGLDKEAIPVQSAAGAERLGRKPPEPGASISLSGFLINSMVDSSICKGLQSNGEAAITFLKKQLIKQGADPNDLTGDKFTVVAGDYSYALVMGLALTVAGIAIIIAGNEGEAEEKTILPLKK